MKIWETLPPRRKKKKKLNKKEAIRVLNEVGEIIRKEMMSAPETPTAENHILWAEKDAIVIDLTKIKKETGNENLKVIIK